MTNQLKTGVVKEFTGEYFFLSNFCEGQFEWRNMTFRTAEHAFQAAKGYHIPEPRINDMRDYMDKVIDSPTPAKAKYAGRSVTIDIKSWDDQKVWYMREIVHAKFTQVQGIAGQLVNTGAMMLVEGNDWNDTFWGRCNGKGFNTLGVILMEERGIWSRGPTELLRET